MDQVWWGECLIHASDAAKLREMGMERPASPHICERLSWGQQDKDGWSYGICFDCGKVTKYQVRYKAVYDNQTGLYSFENFADHFEVVKKGKYDA